jgi:hypothetical protein
MVQQALEYFQQANYPQRGHLFDSANARLIVVRPTLRLPNKHSIKS